nr:alpha/beta hydrolase [Natronocella acetinitrilica]
MIPGDKESWHKEWYRVAEENRKRGDQAETNGHIETAKNCWIRAVDYYRNAEFWLPSDDPRRMETFDKCESCFQKAGRHFNPKVEKVLIPYENGQHLHAYYLKSPRGGDKQPVLISFGGLDSFKEELYFMVARGAMNRGISCLLVDGPGQGATIRREKIYTRYDYEVPVGACIDYLETRDDIDLSRIAVSGSSMGGYYAARAGSCEPRLAATISHGGNWSVYENWQNRSDDHGLVDHINWVTNSKDVHESREKLVNFTLDGVLENMKCPYLIVHGGHDVLGVKQASKLYDYATKMGVNVTIKFVSEEETGADHCQHDNPTIGQEYMMDWLADQFQIDQKALNNA